MRLARGPDAYPAETETSPAPHWCDITSGNKGSHQRMCRSFISELWHLKKCSLEPVFQSGSMVSEHFIHCVAPFYLPVVAVVLLFSNPHPSPLPSLHLFTLGPHVLPDPAHGKVCLCPGLLSYFCLSRLFPLSSYFCLLSAFISLTSGWGGSAARTIQIDHLERRRAEGDGGGGGEGGDRVG